MRARAQQDDAGDRAEAPVVVGRAEKAATQGATTTTTRARMAPRATLSRLRHRQDLAIVAARPQDEKAIERQIGRELGNAISTVRRRDANSVGDR